MSRTVEVDDDHVACYTSDGAIHLISNRVFYAMLVMEGMSKTDSMIYKPYVRYENGSKMFSVSKGEFEKIAHEADAVHLHNKTAYVNVNKVCQYIEGLDDGKQ